jgi:hypothetical protein
LNPRPIRDIPGHYRQITPPKNPDAQKTEWTSGSEAAQFR